MKTNKISGDKICYFTFMFLWVCMQHTVCVSSVSWGRVMRECGWKICQCSLSLNTFSFFLTRYYFVFSLWLFLICVAAFQCILESNFFNCSHVHLKINLRLTRECSNEMFFSRKLSVTDISYELCFNMAPAQKSYSPSAYAKKPFSLHGLILHCAAHNMAACLLQWPCQFHRC